MRKDPPAGVLFELSFRSFPFDDHLPKDPPWMLGARSVTCQDKTPLGGTVHATVVATTTVSTSPNTSTAT